MAIQDELQAIHQQAKELASAVADNLWGIMEEWLRRFAPASLLEEISLTTVLVRLFIVTILAGFTYVMFFIPPAVLGLLLWAMRELAVPGARAFLGLIDLFRKDLEPALSPIIASTLSELMGTEFSE